jgi:hypothetical protein
MPDGEQLFQATHHQCSRYGVVPSRAENGGKERLVGDMKLLLQDLARRDLFFL